MQAVDQEAGTVKDSLICPHCKALLEKKDLERVWFSHYDAIIDKNIKQAKQIPVLINYSIDGHKGRFEKTPDDIDIKRIYKIDNSDITYFIPNDLLPDGDNTKQPKQSHGFTNVHHFFFKKECNNLIKIMGFF